MMVRASAFPHAPACDRPRLAGIAHLVGFTILLFGHAADGLQSPPRDAGGGRLEFADCRRLGRGGGGGRGAAGAVGGVVSVRGPAGSVVTRRGAGAPAAFVVRGVCAGPVLVCAAPPPHLPDCGAGGVCPLPGDASRYCRCGARGAFRLRAVYRCPPGTYFAVSEGRCVSGLSAAEPPRPSDEAGPQLEAPPTAPDAGACVSAPAPAPAPADSAGREASPPVGTPAASGAAEIEDADAATTVAAARDADGAVYDAGSQNSTSGNSTDRVLAGPVSTNTRNVSRADSSGGSGSDNATTGNNSAPSYEVPAGAVLTSVNAGNFRTAVDSSPISQTVSSGRNDRVLASAVPTNTNGVLHAIVSGGSNSHNATTVNVAPISTGHVPASVIPNISANAGDFHTAGDTGSATQNATSGNKSATKMGQKMSSLLSTLAQAVLDPAANLIATAALNSPSVNVFSASTVPVPVNSIPVATNTACVPANVPSVQIGNAPAYKHSNAHNTNLGVADTNPGHSPVTGPANNVSYPSVPIRNATPAPVRDPVSVHDRSRAPNVADANKPSLSNCTCVRCGKPHVLDSYAASTPIIAADANVNSMPVGMRMLDLFLQENDRRFQEMVCSKTINEESSSSTMEDSKTTVVVLQDEKGQNNTELKCKGGKVLEENSASMPVVGLQSNAKSSTSVGRRANVWQFVPLYTLRNEESKQLSNIGLCGVTGVTNTGDGREEEKNWEFLSEDSEFEGPKLKLKDIIESITRSENTQRDVRNVASSETIAVSTNNTHLSKNVHIEDISHRNGSESVDHFVTISRKTRDKDAAKVDSSDLVSSTSKSSEQDDLLDRIKEGTDTLQDNIEPWYFVDSQDYSEHDANYNTNPRKVRRCDCSDTSRSIEPQIQCSSGNSKLKEHDHSKAVQRLVDVLSASIGSLYPEDEKIISKKCINVTALRTLFRPKEDKENDKETVNDTSVKHLNETEFASASEVPAKSPIKSPISTTDTHHCKCDIPKDTLIEPGKDEDVHSDFSDDTNGSENHDKLSDSHGNRLHCRDRNLALNILYLLFKALDDSLRDDIVPEHTTERPPVIESEKEVKKDEPTTGKRIALNTNPVPNDRCYWDFSIENDPEIANDDRDEFDATETSDPVAHINENIMQKQLHHLHNMHHSSHSTFHSKSNNQIKYLQNTEEGNRDVNSPESPGRTKETYTGESSVIKIRHAIKSPELSLSKCDKNRDVNTKSMKHGSQTSITSITREDLPDEVSNKSEDPFCGRNSKACVTSEGNAENMGHTQSRRISPTSGFTEASSRYRKTDERGQRTSDQPLYNSIDDASWMNSHHYNAPSDYSEEDWQSFIWQKQIESSEEKQTSETFTTPLTTRDDSALKCEFDKLLHDGSQERTGNRDGSETNESEDSAEAKLFEKFCKVLTGNERLRTQFNSPSHRGVRKNVQEQTSNKGAADTTENNEKIPINNQGKTQKIKYSDVFLTGTRRYTNVESENNSRRTYEKVSSGDEKIIATPFLNECEREERSYCCSVEESTFWDHSTEENTGKKHERDSNTKTKLDVAVSREQLPPEESENYEREQEGNTEEPIPKQTNVEMGMVSSEEDADYWDFNFEEGFKDTPKNRPNKNMELTTVSDDESGKKRPSMCECPKPTLPLIVPIQRGRTPKCTPICTTKQATRNNKNNVEPEKSSDIDDDEKYTGPSVCICSKPTLPLIAPAKTCNRDFPGRIPIVTTQPQMSRTQRYETEQTEIHDISNEEYMGPSVCKCSKPTFPLTAPTKKCDRDFLGPVPTVTTQQQMTKSQRYQAEGTETYDIDDEYTGPSVCKCSKLSLPLVAPTAKCDRDFPGRVPSASTQPEKNKRCESQQKETYDSHGEEHTGPSVCIMSKPTLPLKGPSKKCHRDLPGRIPTITTQPQMTKNQRNEAEETETYDTDDEEYTGPSVCICSKPTLPLIAPAQKCRYEVSQNRRGDTHERKTNYDSDEKSGSLGNKPTLPLNAPTASWDCHLRRLQQSEATEAAIREINIAKLSGRQWKANNVRSSPQRKSDRFSDECLSCMETSVDDNTKICHNKGTDDGVDNTWNIKMERQSMCQHKKSTDPKISRTISDNVFHIESHDNKRRTGSSRAESVSESMETRKHLGDTIIDHASSENSERNDGHIYSDFWDFEIPGIEDEGSSQEYNDNVSSSDSETSQKKTNLVVISMVPPLSVSSSETRSQSAMTSSTKSTEHLDFSRKSLSRPYAATENNDVENINTKRDNVKISHSSYNGNKKSASNGDYVISDNEYKHGSFEVTDNSEKGERKLGRVPSYRKPFTSTSTADLRGMSLNQGPKPQRIEDDRPQEEYSQQRSSRPNRKEHTNEYYSDANVVSDEVVNAAVTPPQATPPKYSNEHYFRGYLRSLPTNLSQDSKTQRIEVNRPKEEYPQQRSSRPHREERSNEYYTDADEVDNAVASPSQESPLIYSNKHKFRGYLRSIPTNRVQLSQEQEKNRHRIPFSESSRGPNVHDFDGNSNSHKTQPQKRQRYRGQTYSYTRETGHSQASGGPADSTSTPSGPGSRKSDRRNLNIPSNQKSSSASAISNSETSDPINPSRWFLHWRPWSHRLREKTIT